MRIAESPPLSLSDWVHKTIGVTQNNRCQVYTGGRGVCPRPLTNSERRGVIHKKVGRFQFGLRNLKIKAPEVWRRGKAHGVKINCCIKIVIKKGGSRDVYTTKKR